MPAGNGGVSGWPLTKWASGTGRAASRPGKACSGRGRRRAVALENKAIRSSVYRMSADGNRFQFTADRGDARLRLDQALVRRVGRDLKLSRTQAQQWIDAGLVELDGQPARRASQTLADGTVVVVTVP